MCRACRRVNGKKDGWLDEMLRDCRDNGCVANVYS